MCGVSHCESFAMVVASTDTELIITTSFADYKTPNEQFMDPLSIPWPAIVQFQVVPFTPKKWKGGR